MAEFGLQKILGQKRRSQVKPIVLSVGGALAVLISLAVYLGPPPLISLDHWYYDNMVRWRARFMPVSDRTVIVDIDEDSLTTVGQWPWPRYRIAALLRKLASAGPSVIGVDILFAEPDRTSLSTIREAFQKEFGLELGFSGIPPGMDNNDAYLGHVFGRTRTIGAIFFYFGLEGAGPGCQPTPLKTVINLELIAPHESSGILCNTPSIQESLTAYGFMNNLQDRDGLLRRFPLLIRYKNDVFSNLSLSIVMSSTGHSQLQVEEDFFGPILRIGALTVPVDREGNSLLQFHAGAGTHRIIAALDVLNDNFDPSWLSNRIILIGSSAVGLNDLHHTPGGPGFQGTQIHATFLDNVFDHTSVREPVWRDGYSLSATLATGLLISTIFAFAGPVAAASGALLAALSSVGLSAGLFIHSGLFLPTSGPVLSAVAEFSLLSLILYALERRRAYIQLQRLFMAQRFTLEAMAAVAETRDVECGAHIKRTQHYVKILADFLMNRGAGSLLTPDYIDLLFHSAPLHDVGKVGIPDVILFKPSKLTAEEFETMKLHSVYGQQIMKSAAKGSQDHEFLDLAAEIALSHHEKWDGSGYPGGLAGEAIPLSGRIMALADVYDALTSVRRYKRSFSHEEAHRLIIESRGTHFDPLVVDAYLILEEEFVHISRKFKDEEGAAFQLEPEADS